MLKDITLGQYFPGDTPVHNLDPRTKLLLTVVYIAGLFTVNTWGGYALVFAALTPLGLAPLGALAGHVRARTGGWITLACAEAVLPACGALCRVVPLMSVRRETWRRRASPRP